MKHELAGKGNIGEPWKNFLKDFLRDVGGTLWGRCRGNLRGCRGNLGGTLVSTFLEDFLRDVGGTFGDVGDISGGCRGNRRGLDTSTALRSSKNPFRLDRLIGEKCNFVKSVPRPAPADARSTSDRPRSDLKWTESYQIDKFAMQVRLCTVVGCARARQ